jgi:nascent polypeptide-associated complex subunit alpha
MLPGMDPKKMQAMMKQLGIAQEDISANRVIIECDDKNIVIENPSVVSVKMQGQENFQISGDVSENVNGTGSEEAEEDKTEEDVRTIMEKVGCLEQEARMALEKSEGDLTEALLSLS